MQTSIRLTRSNVGFTMNASKIGFAVTKIAKREIRLINANA